MFWYTASAVPRYQLSLTRFMGGRISMNSPSSRATTELQPSRMWRFRERGLFWGRKWAFRRAGFMQVGGVVWVMGGVAPQRTAGVVRCRVRGKSGAVRIEQTFSRSAMVVHADAQGL